MGKMAEDVAEYWVADTTIKPSKLTDRRIEVQGKGRGTVTQGSKKGALIAFDGNPAEWVGSFDDVLEEQQPLKESSVNKFAEERLRKYEEEVVVRAAKEESKKKATLAQLNLEWKKAYGTDKKNKSGFGVVAKRAIARATGNEVLQSVDLVDANDVRAEAWEQFELLDIDKSGSVDQREMDRIDDWFRELKLVDELGVEIPEAQYAVGKKEIFGDRWTVDFEEFMEWFTEVEAVEATETTDAVEEKKLSSFALAVRNAIVKNRPEEVFAAESESEEDDPNAKK